MIEIFIKVKNIILDTLFPPICLVCQKPLTTANNNLTNNQEYKKYLCDNCYNSIQINTSLFCPVCRLRLAENKKICSHANYLLAAAGNYDDLILQNLIHCFKYKSFENLVSVLGEIIIKYIKNCQFKIENFIVVPIPLYYSREKQRGFNQSKLLAEYIAQNLNLEMANILKRIKNTKPQAQCKNEKRKENVLNCFQLKNATGAEKIKNKNILLVDDVFTSGATINEAVKILKQNGCKKIIALVIAKA